jgi:hypothetical protein
MYERDNNHDVGQHDLEQEDSGTNTRLVVCEGTFWLLFCFRYHVAQPDEFNYLHAILVVPCRMLQRKRFDEYF